MIENLYANFFLNNFIVKEGYGQFELCEKDDLLLPEVLLCSTILRSFLPSGRGYLAEKADPDQAIWLFAMVNLNCVRKMVYYYLTFYFVVQYYDPSFLPAVAT